MSCLSDNCIECSSSTVCLICTPGYTLAQGYCVQCSQKVPSCQSCSYSLATGQETCLSCQNQYFLSKGQCLQCPPSCL